jgi:hypothetical protein
MEKIKCYEITPSPRTAFDVLIIEDKGSWREAISFAEESLECQFLDDDKDWDEISVTIKCVYKSRQELNELEIE